MLIYHHLGLGDHLICNGLVRTLSQAYNIKLLCKTTNTYNIQLMYSDNPKIEIISIYNDDEANAICSINQEHIRLGLAINGIIPNKNALWDEIFYSQAGVNFDHSWSHFLYNKSKKQNPIPQNKYAFLCNKGSDGVDGLDYSLINKELNHIYSNNGGFFDNIDLIYNAKEVHCINSSYIHLIDRLSNFPDNIKLFYHRNFVRKPYSYFTLKKNWIIV
jgi:hypothetical protein